MIDFYKQLSSLQKRVLIASIIINFIIGIIIFTISGMFLPKWIDLLIGLPLGLLLIVGFNNLFVGYFYNKYER